MSRHYKIWHEIEACNYAGSKSYGSKDTAETTVKIGTSKKNSHVLVQHVTTQREEGEYTVFRFGVSIGDSGQLDTIATRYMHTKSREMRPEGFEPVQVAA